MGNDLQSCVNTSEAASILGVSRWTARRMVLDYINSGGASGLGPVQYRGKRYYVTRQALADYMERHTVGAKHGG